MERSDHFAQEHSGNALELAREVQRVLMHGMGYGLLRANQYGSYSTGSHRLPDLADALVRALEAQVPAHDWEVTRDDVREMLREVGSAGTVEPEPEPEPLLLPGHTFKYRYCGHDYDATVLPTYRVRVLRSGPWAGCWELLVESRFKTGSGRVHKKEASVGIADKPDERERLLKLLEKLGARDGVLVHWPRTDRDSFYGARRAYQRGRHRRLKGESLGTTE